MGVGADPRLGILDFGDFWEIALCTILGFQSENFVWPTFHSKNRMNKFFRYSLFVDLILGMKEVEINCDGKICVYGKILFSVRAHFHFFTIFLCYHLIIIKIKYEPQNEFRRQWRHHRFEWIFQYNRSSVDSSTNTKYDTLYERIHESCIVLLYSSKIRMY